jgi:hypothetical protein
MREVSAELGRAGISRERIDAEDLIGLRVVSDSAEVVRLVTAYASASKRTLAATIGVPVDGFRLRRSGDRWFPLLTGGATPMPEPARTRMLPACQIALAARRSLGTSVWATACTTES